MGSFDQLSTVCFQERMLPYADALYQSVFPKCRIERLAHSDRHILDRTFAVDVLLHLSCGGFITMQEKFREHAHWVQWGDFTQEFKNAVGTDNESEGEWFKLSAQLYFYGWGDEEESGFRKWIMIDVVKYKILVDRSGGLSQIGKKQQNNKHGRASFYGIPLDKLKPAVLFHKGIFERA